MKFEPEKNGTGFLNTDDVKSAIFKIAVNKSKVQKVSQIQEKLSSENIEKERNKYIEKLSKQIQEQVNALNVMQNTTKKKQKDATKEIDRQLQRKYQKN